jgi:hypothetical protein
LCEWGGEVSCSGYLQDSLTAQRDGTCIAAPLLAESLFSSTSSGLV